MAKVLVVTSGKGGVGKTTTTAAIGAALAQAGQKVVVVDFDVGLRNLDLVMGAERRVVFDLINVVQGIAKLPQALIRDKRIETLWLLPASQTRDKDALTDDGVDRVIGELRAMLRLDRLRQSGRHRARRDAGDALRRRGGRRHQSGSLLGARLRSHHRHARLQDREGREGRARRQAPADHPLRSARGRRAATCSGSRTCSKSLRRRCSASSPRARRCCAPRISAAPVTVNNPASAPSRAYVDATQAPAGRGGRHERADRSARA